MSAILETKNNWTEFQSHRVYPENWNKDREGQHWIAVPPELESVILPHAPYIKVTYKDETEEEIIDVEILPVPEPEPEPYIETYEDKLLLSMIS